MAMYAVILILPWLVALVLTPLVIRWASVHGWLDHPRGRKNHSHPVPMLGGVAVFAAVTLGLLLAAPFSVPIRVGLFGSGSLLALAGGVAAILALGLYDDRKDLRASLKLAAQIAIAVLTWLLGFRVGAVELPFGWVISASPVPSFLVTVSWIVIVTNAFNLIDGLDGLAAGVGIEPPSRSSCSLRATRRPCRSSARLLSRARSPAFSATTFRPRASFSATRAPWESATPRLSYPWRLTRRRRPLWS